MNKCIHFVAPFFLIGCGLRNVDKPAPSSYELWKKDGMSIVEVQIDMLECGYPNPMGYFESTFEDGGVNAFAMAGRCLKRIGYRYVGNSGVSCDSSHFASLPACQNDKPIWEPDYHRRLNSPFCKESPKAYACQPHPLGATTR